MQEREREHEGEEQMFRCGLTGIRTHLAFRWPLPPLAVSTRSSLSSHCWSTQTVPEKVHAVPLTQKQLSTPWLSRNLSVSLGSVFSGVSCTFDVTEFRLDIFPCQRSCFYPFSSLSLARHRLEWAVSTIPVWLCHRVVKLSMLWRGTETVGKYFSSIAARTVSS